MEARSARRTPRRATVALAAAVALAASGAAIEPGEPRAGDISEDGAFARDLFYPPFARDPALRARWIDGNRAEFVYDYAAAARTFETIAERAPEDPHLAWRIARDYVLLGELTRTADRARRKQLGQLTVQWAKRGLTLDPDCAECCLYRFAGTGLIARSETGLLALRWIRPLSQTLDRCLANPPTFAHAPWDQEAGNLYYAAARFYRLLPESGWASFALGASGNKERALEYSRRAFAISPGRIDYNAELAAASICAARERDDPALRAAGLALLADVALLENVRATDLRERDAAARLAADPDRACSYSRREWSDAGAVDPE